MVCRVELVITHRPVTGCWERRRDGYEHQLARECFDLWCRLYNVPLTLWIVNVEEFDPIYFRVLVDFDFYFLFVTLGRALHMLTLLAMHMTIELHTQPLVYLVPIWRQDAAAFPGWPWACVLLPQPPEYQELLMHQRAKLYFYILMYLEY